MSERQPQEPAERAYLAAIFDFNAASRQAWKALHDAETIERSAGQERREQSEERRHQIDDSLRRASEGRDLVLSVQERTGAGEVPRQIASAGLAFPDWDTASDNLNACTSRLEQAETELRDAERAVERWHNERGQRARALIWFAAVAVGVIVLLAFILDLAARFRFLTGATFLLVIFGAVLVAAAGGTAAVLLKHPDAIEGPALRTRVNVPGLTRLCLLRIGVPAFLVILGVRIILGIILTIVGLFH
ncbi:MAG TPA: hypothetical protein VF053_21740 [Streptosporangiales bacterium]